MFKVRCKLISFEGDEKRYPCHFRYKIGDEFYYDGVNFTGGVCVGLLASMMPVIHGVFLLGHKSSENVFSLYRGHDAIDTGMASYDGVGFKPLKTLAGGTPTSLPAQDSNPIPEVLYTTTTYGDRLIRLAQNPAQLAAKPAQLTPI